MEQTAFLREIHAKLTQVFEENYMSQLPAIPGDSHIAWTVSSTAYLRNLDEEDLERECIAIHHQNAPKRNESGGATLSVKCPALIVSLYYEPSEIAERVAAILNAHWDTFGEPAADPWRPIDENTPREGWDSPILTCRMGEPDHRLGGQLLSGYAEPPEAAYWNDAGDCWTPIQRPHDPWEPTHWMPPPAAPSLPIEKGDEV